MTGLDDINADIHAAMEGVENGSTEVVEAGDPGGDGATLGGLPGAGDAAGVAGGAASEPGAREGESLAEAAARARDEKGRFATGKPGEKAKGAATVAPVVTVKPTLTPAPKPGEASVTPTPAPAVTTEALKAPQSWKPAAREAFAKAPPEVQAEAVRVDREVRAAMQDSAESRKFHSAFQQMAAPYAASIQAEGGNALQAAANLFQTAHALRTAPPAHKAQLVAQIVQQFGVPIEALDAALSGQPQAAQQGGGQQPQYQDPRVDQLMSHLQSAAQQRQQATAQRAARDIETFQAKAEFLDDVRPHMAALLSDAAQRGQAMTLDEAYDAACWSNKEIRDILKRREASEAANATTASTQRARAAASSGLRSQPASAGNSQPSSGDSVDADIQAAIAQLSRR